jgi:hypothetical protein
MKHFHHIDVLTVPSNKKVIHWVMDRNFTTDPGYTAYFYIDWARSGGPWTCLNPTTPVTDNCFYVDTNRYNYNMEKNLYYRVRVIIRPDAAAGDSSSSSNSETSEDSGDWETYVSIPEQALGVLQKENYLVMKEIVRKEYLNLKKKGGIQGFLLKRKEWGETCPDCTGYDIEEVINGSCPICYGTGITGGYYAGIEYWISITPNARDRSVNEGGLGTMNPQTRMARGVAYPWIDSGDIWVDAQTNERYIIRKIQHVAEMEGKPIVYNLQLNRLPETDISMDIPIEDVNEDFEIEVEECPAETVPLTEKVPDEPTDIVKSTETTDDGGWRRGLEDENW